MRPLCGFCGGHHYPEEPHPGEAVREALAKLRRTEPPVSAIEVGRKTFVEVQERVASVTESPPAVTEKGVVTESPLPEVPVLPKRGRPKKAEALSRAEIQRAYRERREA